MCFKTCLHTARVSVRKMDTLWMVTVMWKNMKRAQKRDAVLTERFWWRKDIFTVCEDDSEPEMTEMSIDEILNGIPGSDYQVGKLAEGG